VYVASNDLTNFSRFVGLYAQHIHQLLQLPQTQQQSGRQHAPAMVVVEGAGAPSGGCCSVSEVQAVVAAMMEAAVALAAEWMLPPLLCLLPLLGCQSVDHPAVLRVLQAACTVGSQSARDAVLARINLRVVTIA
jgi:hypothetical protein